MSGRQAGAAWLLVGLAFVALMPSRQSLWIDEGFTARYAEDKDISGFAARLGREQGSEALMPLGMFSTWLGAKLLGRSETGLRLVSALWAALAVFLLWRAGRLVGAPWLGPLAACHPLLWYHGGEVRPYAMTVALGAGLLYGFFKVVVFERHTGAGVRAVLASGTLLCATYVLGIVPFAVVVGVVGVKLVSRRWRPRPPDLAAIGSAAFVLALLAVYYRGALARAADESVRPRGVGLGSLVDSAWELLGFIGFGPGRYELRQAAFEGGIAGAARALVGPALIGAVALAVLYGLITVRACSRQRAARSAVNRSALLAVGIVAAALAILYAVCFATSSPFWGRHVASLLSFVVFAVGLASAGVDDGGRRSFNAATASLGVVLLASSLLVRFGPDHRRDDYRGAATIAHTAVAQGKIVWWVAAAEAADYYGVSFCAPESHQSPQCVVHAAYRSPAELAALPKPDVIVLSKPVFHDAAGAVRAYIGANGFELTGRLTLFEVYEKP